MRLDIHIQNDDIKLVLPFRPLPGLEQGPVARGCVTGPPSLVEMRAQTEPNLRNKLSRGKFTAAFMLACLNAIGARNLNL
jgi:hypothetical protein